MNKELSPEEYKVISAVMDGSLNTIKKYLPKCDIKKIGVLALRQSLGWEDLEIAQYLIKKGVEPSHALYHSSHQGIAFEIDNLFKIHQFSITDMAQACGMAVLNGHQNIIEKFFLKMPELKQHAAYFINIARTNNEKILPFLNEQISTSNTLSSKVLH